MDDHLKESRVDGGLAYDGVFLKVQADTVRLPDGKHAVREFIRHPGAVVILPLFEDGSVLLERQSLALTLLLPTNATLNQLLHENSADDT